MSIWEYRDHSTSPPRAVRLQRCRYCDTLLNLPSPGGAQGSDPWMRREAEGFDRSPDWEWVAAPDRWLNACPACGWWAVSHHERREVGLDVYGRIYRAAGVLKSLDVSDISIPLDELSRYLVANYRTRFLVNPKRYEDVVAGVFRDAGYRVRVTSYSGDDGVDIFVLDGDVGDIVGVQVKRYQGSILAEQIREFAGALILNQLTRGVYVTTSKFTRGAENTASRFSQGGLAIELWDAHTFYDRLRLAQRPQYEDPDDPSAPFAAVWRDRSSLPEVAMISGGRG
jgi:hypothetical protein